MKLFIYSCVVGLFLSVSVPAEAAAVGKCSVYTKNMTLYVTIGNSGYGSKLEVYNLLGSADAFFKHRGQTEELREIVFIPSGTSVPISDREVEAAKTTAEALAYRKAAQVIEREANARLDMMCSARQCYAPGN